MVGALTGAVLGRLEEADVMHIYGGCAHWVCFGQASASFRAYLWWVRSLGLLLAVLEEAVLCLFMGGALIRLGLDRV